MVKDFLLNILTGDFMKKNKSVESDLFSQAVISTKILEKYVSHLRDELIQSKNLISQERLEYDRKISADLLNISNYINGLHSLALKLVNDKKYYATKEGNFLNLNFLSKLNEIKHINLVFSRNVSYDFLISQLNRILKILEEIRFKEN